MSEIVVPEPFPIYKAGNRYFLHDVDTIAYVRRIHNICGVLIGTIPHLSQQNIFLGAPLELMPEEVRVLVKNGHACIRDDVKAHTSGILQMNEEERAIFMHLMENQGREAAQSQQRKAKERSEKALEKISKDKSSHKTVPEDESRGHGDPDDILFSTSPSKPTVIPDKDVTVDLVFGITPSTSYPPLPPVTHDSDVPLPDASVGYPLFRFLHSKGYFLTPGLRFGCNYTVYPGDPLRFHSHFLAVGASWDDEINLLDIVGGGRLGTGVKKGYLLGGEIEDDSKESKSGNSQGAVKILCIEWAQM